MVIDRRSSLGSLGCVVSAVALLGCAASGGETDAEGTGAALEAAPALMVKPFEDPEGIAAVGDGEHRRSISSAGQYRRAFGHAPPDGVDLSGRAIAIFYTPGVQNTGGYEATFEKVEVSGRTLVVTTRLSSPGPNCVVTQALTHPYALASLQLPRGVRRIRFESDDVVRDCEAPPTCDGTECPDGQHCELTPVVCIKAPCPAIPECVDDRITCGGFTGKPCPDGLTCIDDPSDDCDPNNGGADCGGICVSEPPIDACSGVKCEAGTHCEVIGGDAAACVPDPQFCGGIAAFPCPDNLTCVDNPDDDCDPNNGGADCGGICVCVQNKLCARGAIFDPSPEVCACVADPSADPCAAVRCRAGSHCEVVNDQASCVPDAPFCGGIAGIECPGEGMCVDDPNDDCDPNQGGADCGGLCECNVLGLCQQGYVWDPSPDVCGCVLENPCIATLCGPGTTCEVIDGNAYCLSDGTQQCGKTTCGEGTSCCNSSCGICTQPGFFCIQIACEDGML
jgi:PrcB C-terminal